MAKARAIVKRRKAVRNTRKITKTMQMIATAKFQKALKRVVGAKPMTDKLREIVADLVENVEGFVHPLIASPERPLVGKVIVLAISGNRGLAGAYNGTVLRAANVLVKEFEKNHINVELHTAGKKAFAYFNFLKRPVTARHDALVEDASFEEIRDLTDMLMKRYTHGDVDAVYVVFMNFISTGVQRPERLKLLPLEGVSQITEHLARQAAEGQKAHDRVGKGGSVADVAKAEAQLAARGQFAEVRADEQEREEVLYEFSPSAKELLDELLPIAVRSSLLQAFMDATTSEKRGPHGFDEGRDR